MEDGPLRSASSSEGRYASHELTSAAWISDIGGRKENQDQAVTHVHTDGAWLIAVADGMGGQPRGREAAIAATRGLPIRIRTSAGMFDAFADANNRVVQLRPDYLEFTLTSLHMCPAATLCTAAWTPQGGMVVGQAGDTLAVLLRHDGESWHGRVLGHPHRRRDGTISRYVGSTHEWSDSHGADRDRVHITTESDIATPADGYAVVILSDGVWEPLIHSTYTGEPGPISVLGDVLPAILQAEDNTAPATHLALRIMNATRNIGLDDNATIAVATVAAQTGTETN